MKRLLSWLLVLTMLVACLPMSVLPAFAVETDVDTGDDFDLELEMDELLPTETEPEDIYFTLSANREVVTIPAGGYAYGELDITSGAFYNVNAYSTDSGAWSMGLWRNVQFPADADGVYMASISTEGMTVMNTGFEVLTFTFYNSGEEAVTIIAWAEEIQASEPEVGTYENPAELVLGENVSNHAEGGMEYYYTYTAEKDGILELEISSSAAGWFYVVNNKTAGVSGDFQWSDSNPAVNPVEVEVSAGDVLDIQVNTYDPANMWTAPAGTVTVNASYAEPAPEYNVVTSAYGLSLEAELVVSAKFLVPDELKNDPDATMTIQFIDSITEVKLADYIAENGVDNKGRFTIKQSVRSPWMPHFVKVTICDGDGNAADFTDYFGDTYEGSYEFGAETYVKLTTVAAAGESTINCIRGLLTYGAYAQTYFESTGSIPNIPEMRATEILTKYGYEPLDISGFSSDLLDQAPTSSGDSFDGISSRGVANPVLEAAIYMVFQFNATGITEADMGNYTYKLSYMSGDTLVEKDITPSWDSRGRLVFNITEIAAMYFDCMYSVTVTKIATGETYTGSTSVIAYMDVAFANYEGVASQANFLNLLKAMYYYNQAANVHFGK